MGSSGALPVNGRFTSSQVLTVHPHLFLIDCGEGCQMQLRKYDVSLLKINHIFISHLHGDHYLGFTGLLFSMHLLRRVNDLHVYSFSGLGEILLAQLKHSRSSLNFKVILHPLTDDGPRVIFDDDHVTVTSFPLDHKIPNCGFLFREKPRPRSLDKTKPLGGIPTEYLNRLNRGEDITDASGAVLYRADDYALPPLAERSYAYCSDTQPSEAVVEVIRGTHLVYHEATFLEREKEKARQTRHSTAEEAAVIAQKAGVQKLILGHFSARYKDLDQVLAEATRIFPNAALALEGETFHIA